MSDDSKLAVFEVDKNEKLKVHFNPVSLKVTSSNQLADKSDNAHQTSAKTATKMDVELIFDTTDTGEDVQVHTDKLKALATLKKTTKPLAKVTFRWGHFAFTGSIESLNETFDFFSAEGVPLRCTVQVSMKGLKLNEALPRGEAQPQGGASMLPPSSSGDTGATGAAQAAGDPNAGRAIARQNGLESMRKPPSGPLALPQNVQLKAPAGETMAVGLGALAAASAGAAAASGAFAGLGGSAAIRIGPLEIKATDQPTPQSVIGPQARFDLSGRLLETAAQAGLSSGKGGN
jgi:Contractile injection system tube protein